jgi:hypothetical protein
MLQAAKAMAMTAVDLLVEPAHLARAADQFQEHPAG